MLFWKWSMFQSPRCLGFIYLFISQWEPLDPRMGLVQPSCSVMSDSLQPRGLQHARLPCPSPVTGACSNSCPSSQWCHPGISSFVVPFSSFPSIRVFSNESVLCIRWPKYWSSSFSISPSNEHSGLISSRMGYPGISPAVRWSVVP